MSIYDTLNPKQKEAVLHTDGPLLILAGAGSGKTRVLTHRIAYLIDECGVNPWNIMAITFTNKAAGEMRERVDDLVGFGAESIWVSTFHSSCVRILRRHIESLGYTTSFSIYDSDDQKTLMRQVFKAMNVDTKQFKERSVLAAISSAKDKLITPEEFLLNAGADFREKKTGEIYKEYQKQLRKNNALDFDDLIVKTVELFQNNPQVLDYYQERFKYIMVDEYQDTNMAQFKLVSLLASKYRNLCVVGDDDQSIYRFRGAKPEIMLGFERDYPKAARVLLDVNYRSTREIVEASLRLIEHNEKRFKKSLKTAGSRGRGVITRIWEDEEEENSRIAEEIRMYAEAGCSYSDIAVLYRTNSGPKRLIEKLMEHNLPFRARDQVPNLYEHWISQNILSYIRVALGNRDRAEVLQMINRPARYVGRDALRDPQVSFEQLKAYYKDKDWMVERIENLEFDLTAVSRMSPLAAVNYIRKSIGYDAWLYEYAAAHHVKAEELLETAEQLRESAARYKTFDAWFEHIRAYGEELKRQAREREEQADAVMLSTMHSSKGLEYRVVYILDANEGVTPHNKAVLDADIEEERRLFYVAMTRAKQRLHVYGVKNRYHKPAEVSRFVEEYLEEQDGKEW